MDIFEKINEKSRTNKLNQKLQKVLALDETFSKMTDDELRQKNNELFQRRKNGESESKLMSEAFALVREATWRTLGMKQYPVQIKGAISIAEGNLAELATGEGKTLVVPLVSYLHALSGENVHVITSNEYLAKRDSEQMSKLFGFLGMDVGLSVSGMQTEEKQKAYSCNITYTTATELGFDYLRDNDAINESGNVLRGLNSIVIDEADHTLLDDARTPLILSYMEDVSKYHEDILRVVAKAIDTLEEGIDYEVELDKRLVSLSEKGMDKLENFFHIDDMFSEENFSLFNYCNNALDAKVLYLKDVNYVVKDGKVELVGETIGRILDGRKYEHGMQQAIEAKEGVKLSSYSKIISNINFQNFFKLYENIGGMSGTCKTDEEELQKIYGLCVDRIETNKPIQRTDEHFRFYHTIEAKNQELKKRIIELHESGRPILLGTASVEKSIELAQIIKDMGLEFNLLNAINEEEESKIIAQAGRFGAITIATNMAGRGTDIKLGGNATFMAKEAMKKQGFSDEIISFADSHLQPKNEKEQAARNEFNKFKESFEIETEKSKQQVLEAGGLAVIGTTLNTSRRIDNQLRGRAGRQGEPGSSEIYVAWEDIRETFKIGEESEDIYIDKLQESIKKNLSDPNKEITDKKIIKMIEDVQKSSEEQMRSIREKNYDRNTPENLQRLALYSEKSEIIQICDEFDPFEVEVSGEPNTSLEKFLYSIYQEDISQIVDEMEAASKSNSNEKTQFLRKQLKKYGFDPEKTISDSFLKNNSKQEVKQKLSTFALKILQKAIVETRDKLPTLAKNIKKDILSEYSQAWSKHLEKLDRAKFQLNMSSLYNTSSADQDFVKNAYYLFDTLKTNVRSKIIKSTTKTLANAVGLIRGLNSENEKQIKSNEENKKNQPTQKN